VITYDIDNVRIRYSGNNNAKAYTLWNRNRFGGTNRHGSTGVLA
jgi:hypothetical protein